MDLTGWLEFFTAGLATQMQETVDRGERVIKTDLLIQQHQFNDRQSIILRHLVDHASSAIRGLEELCPDVSRRTLQRDLRIMEEKGLVVRTGDTNQLVYRVSKEL